MSRETCTNANDRNGIPAGHSRITVYTDYEVVVARIFVPCRNGLDYCKKHKKGEYAEALKIARATAARLDSEHKGSGQMPLFMAAG